MKILFLCHANMCRSPIAEGLLKLIFQKKKIDAIVDSAGFEAFHINELPDKRAVQKALDLGFDISTKRVRLFKKSDFDSFDKIYVMDLVTYRSAISFARSDTDKAKVDFLLNLINPGKNEPLPDPFYEDLEAEKETINLIMQACNLIADVVENGN